MDFNWAQNQDITEIFANIKIKDDVLFNKPFRQIENELHFKKENGKYSGISSGTIIGWKYEPYDWDSIFYKINYSQLNKSDYSIHAMSELGDTIELFVEKDPSGNIYIPVCKGTLKQADLNVKPFYINFQDNYYDFPIVNIYFGNGK